MGSFSLRRTLLLGVLVLASMVGVARYRARNWLAKAPLSAEVLTQAWVTHSFGELTIEAPFALSRADDPQIPDKVRSAVRSIETMSVHKQSLLIQTMTMEVQPGRTVSLDGAADGAFATVRSRDGVTVTNATKENIWLAGLKAVEMAATLQAGGETMKLRGAVAARGLSLYQVQVIYPADSAAGDGVWERIMKSAKVR